MFHTFPEQLCYNGLELVSHYRTVRLMVLDTQLHTRITCGLFVRQSQHALGIHR